MESLTINKIYITKELGDVNKFLIPCINTRCELNVYVGNYTWLKIEYSLDNNKHVIKIPYAVGCDMDMITFATTVIRLTYLECDKFSSNEESYVRTYICDKCEEEQKVFSVFTVVSVILSTYPYMNEGELIQLIGKAINSCVVGVDYPTKEQIRKYF